MKPQALDQTSETGRDALQPPPLRLSRTLHARRETVFKAWSTAEHVKHWFSPETYTVPEAKVELRPGGPFEVCMRAPDGMEHWTRGVFVEVIPDTRLVIDMHASDVAGKPLFRAYTEIDFSDASCGTQVDIVQTYTFIDPAMAAPMVAGAPEGWRTTLDKLEAEVMSMQGGAGISSRSVVHATFHLERTYDAPVERVWQALTVPAAKGKQTTLMVTEQGAFLDGYDDAGSREQGTGLLLDALGASLADGS